MTTVENLTFDTIQPGKAYNARQVAELFSVSVDSVYRAIKKNKIPTLGVTAFGKKLILGQVILSLASIDQIVESETPTERKRRAEEAAIEMARDHGVKLPEELKHKQPKPSRRKK